MPILLPTGEVTLKLGVETYVPGSATAAASEPRVFDIDVGAIE